MPPHPIALLPSLQRLNGLKLQHALQGPHPLTQLLILSLQLCQTGPRVRPNLAQPSNKERAVPATHT